MHDDDDDDLKVLPVAHPQIYFFMKNFSPAVSPRSYPKGNKVIKHYNRDVEFVSEALKEARKALKKGEVPVGAVVVDESGKIVARGHNSPVNSSDPTAHAEIVALKKASRLARNYRLNNFEIYVTKEPCVMCAGALVNARVKRIIFGCYDTKSGACGSVFNIADSKKLNHRIKITGGILEDDCRSLIQNFFKARRGKKISGGETGSTEVF